MNQIQYSALFRLDNETILDLPHKIRMIKKGKKFFITFECPCKKNKKYYKKFKDEISVYKEVIKFRKNHGVLFSHLEKKIEEIKEKRKKKKKWI